MKAIALALFVSLAMALPSPIESADQAPKDVCGQAANCYLDAPKDGWCSIPGQDGCANAFVSLLSSLQPYKSSDFRNSLDSAGYVKDKPEH